MMIAMAFQRARKRIRCSIIRSPGWGVCCSGRMVLRYGVVAERGHDAIAWHSAISSPSRKLPRSGPSNAENGRQCFAPCRRSGRMVVALNFHGRRVPRQVVSVSLFYALHFPASWHRVSSSACRPACRCRRSGRPAAARKNSCRSSAPAPDGDAGDVRDVGVIVGNATINCVALSPHICRALRIAGASIGSSLQVDAGRASTAVGRPERQPCKSGANPRKRAC